MADWVEMEKGEEQTEERIYIHQTCNYIDYTEESKLELSGSVRSEISKSVHHRRWKHISHNKTEYKMLTYI